MADSEYDIFDTMNDYLKEQNHNDSAVWDEVDENDSNLLETVSALKSPPKIRKVAKVPTAKTDQRGRTRASAAVGFLENSETSNSDENNVNENNCIEFDIPIPTTSRQASNNRRNNKRKQTQSQNRRFFNNSFNTICIDADDLPPNSKPLFINSSVVLSDSDEDADLSFESENYEMALKIIWDGKLEKFNIRRHQKIGIVMNIIAEREKSNPKDVLFTFNDRILKADETPASLDYKITDFIHGRIFQTADSGASASSKRVLGPNDIEIKIQSDKFKKPLIIIVNKNESFKVATIKCAEEIGVKPETIQFKFDGDIINLKQTPEDLDMDGGEVIDLLY